MITMALKEVLPFSPCMDSWKIAVEYIEGVFGHVDYDMQLPTPELLKATDLETAVFSFKTRPEHTELWYRFALWCFERYVQKYRPLGINEEMITQVTPYIDAVRGYIEGAIEGDGLDNVHIQFRDALPVLAAEGTTVPQLGTFLMALDKLMGRELASFSAAIVTLDEITTEIDKGAFMSDRVKQLDKILKKGVWVG